MFRGSVKGTGYPLHSSVPSSLPLPCVTVCRHISTGAYPPSPRLRHISVVPTAGLGTVRTEGRDSYRVTQSGTSHRPRDYTVTAPLEVSRQNAFSVGLWVQPEAGQTAGRSRPPSKATKLGGIFRMQDYSHLMISLQTLGGIFRTQDYSHLMISLQTLGGIFRTQDYSHLMISLQTLGGIFRTQDYSHLMISLQKKD